MVTINSVKCINTIFEFKVITKVANQARKEINYYSQKTQRS